MSTCVTLLHRDEPGVALRNLTKIVEFMGGAVRGVTLAGEAARQAEMLRGIVPVGGCVIVGAEDVSAELRGVLIELKARVLVFGFNRSAKSNEVFRLLAAGSVAVATAVEGRKVSVADSREICGAMSGQAFEVEGARVEFVFGVGDYAALLSAGHKPFFVRIKEQGCEWMLLAGDEIADLDAAVEKGVSVLKFFPGLAPVMMFLRAAAPDAFWHNDAPTACFIVDDPLLKSRYGFLDFTKLVGLMDEKGFSTNIAFIPWNYRRSQRRVVEMFEKRPGACSVSVHGCDHTRGEFAGADVESLTERAQLALDRMVKHRELTGLGFDDVMVFPQGLFSTAAMTALKSCGYLAACNSTAYPADEDARFVLRDLLGIAVTRFGGFPLFTRRYPQHIAELAFDLFLGKPALLVEHHGYFQGGYSALLETVERVNKLDARLRWTNVADVCASACWKRTDADGEVQVLFVTDRLELRNNSERQQQCVLMRRGSAGVKSVVVNEGLVKFERDAAGVRARVLLAPGQSVSVRVESDSTAGKVRRRGVDRMYELKVSLRRRLSEFRDNYVQTSRLFGKRTEAASRLDG